MSLKSDRLKKLEMELEDLQKWKDLGLVPKKDLEKHTEEINSIKQKIEEEVQRLKFMKETGEMQEYVAPKKSTKPLYSDAQTMSDMDVDVDTEMDMDETNVFDDTEQEDTTEVSTFVEAEEEDPFSDRNRWKRGVLEDFDEDNW
jgi:hypothetical protein